MKCIFLDIDGVLNNAYSRSLPMIGVKEYNFYCRGTNAGLNDFDPACVDRLNRIVKSTDAKIVISSDWRLYFYGEEFHILRKYLIGRGIRANIIGHTNCFDYADRAKEIEMWLDENEVESFVILEDWCDMGNLEEFTIRTDSDEGLAERHVEQAVRILDGT
jgi:hypothetical protein